MPNNFAAPEQLWRESLVSRVTDEFLERLDQGESPSIEEYVARHPELADVLRQLLPALTVFRGCEPGSQSEPGRQSEPGSHSSGDSAAVQDPLAGCLGDFRLLREIGRGGMGVVYEAEQISLSRRVALKVLPFAAALDPRQLQRFKNEAQAAAHLHHQHIVPVFAVGCERGVHYYAMQFIEGQTLALAMEEMRSRASGVKGQESGVKGQESAAKDRKSPPRLFTPSPPRSAGSDDLTAAHIPDSAIRNPQSAFETRAGSTLRSALSASTSGFPTRRRDYIRHVVELGIQAAEALDYAHEMGVLHRDIKPANLLLDVNGKLWIADFGLAQIQSGTQLTMTGDLIGTLRYMSPEQALAKRVVIDHRTDIYSLGATLYELLTNHAVVEGADRQELLRKIAFEDPKPPRKLDPTIPVDLETILLKCLEKNPTDRYATARQLAEDLRRFRHDEPVCARRPSFIQGLTKWSRRHKSIVAVVAAALAIVGATTLASSMFLWKASRETQRAYVKATENLNVSDRNARRASDNFRRALSAIDGMIAELNTDEVRTIPSEQIRTVRLALLNRASNLYGSYIQPDSSDMAIRHETALAYMGMEEVLFSQGKQAEAFELAHSAVRLLETLVKESPGNDAFSQDFARANLRLARFSYSGSGVAFEKEKAVVLLLRALAEWEKLAAKFPNVLEHRYQIACTLRPLGNFSGVVDPSSREAYKRRSIELLRQLVKDAPDVIDYRRELANAYESLSKANPVDAEALMISAVATWKEAASKSPALGSKVAELYGRLGSFYVKHRRPTDAEKALRLGMDHWAQWLHDPPLIRRDLIDLYATVDQLARIAESGNRINEAEAIYLEASSAVNTALSKAGNSRELVHVLGSITFQLAKLYEKNARNEEAVARYKQAYANFQSLGDEKPMFWISLRRARVLETLGYVSEAEEKTRDAAQFSTRAEEFALAGHWMYLARRFHQRDDVTAANRACDSAMTVVMTWDGSPPTRMSLEPSSVYVESALFGAPNVALCAANVHFDLGVLLTTLGRTTDAERQWRQASQVSTPGEDTDWIPGLANDLAWRFTTSEYPEARNVSLGLRLAQRAVERQGNLTSWNTLGVAHYYNGDWQSAIDALKKSEELSKGEHFAFNGFFFAMASWQLGQRDEARQCYDKSLAWMKNNAPTNEELIRFRDETANLLGATGRNQMDDGQM